MRKFSKIKENTKGGASSGLDKKSDKNLIYQDDYFKIISFEGWNILSESDMVVCIPYLTERNKFIIRHEYIPTFKYREGQEYHTTVISGTIENDETPENCLFRELEEEAGIVINPDYQIKEYLPPLFVSKGNTNKYHPFIIPLAEKDFTEVKIKGDGSVAEKKSKSILLDTKYINNLFPSDLITNFMLEKFKNYLNIK
jgi:8-oxo-dGTP pyrophosphatase MutT (NUDIX family)